MRNPVNSSLNHTGRSPVYSVKSPNKRLIPTGSAGRSFSDADSEDINQFIKKKPMEK